MANKKKLLSTFQVAQILGISRQAVFKKIQSGQLVGEKVGRNYVIDSTQLGVFYKDLGEADKARIQKAVRKVIDEYGDVIRKLGKE